MIVKTAMMPSRIGALCTVLSTSIEQSGRMEESARAMAEVILEIVFWVRILRSRNCTDSFCNLPC